MNVDRDIHQREYHEHRGYSYECGYCYYHNIQRLKERVSKLEELEKEGNEKKS